MTLMTTFPARPFQILVYLLLLGLSSPAQTHPHPRSKEAPSRGPATSSDQQLGHLLATQQQAMLSADPASIASSTRPVAALLLREVARLRLVQGKVSEATALEQKSLELVDSVETRLELTSALLRTGRPDDAATQATAATQAEPRNPTAWAILGSALRAAGKDREAAAALTHSLELKPDVNVAYPLASAFLAIHEKEKAERILSQIITASGNAAIWHVAAGDAYRENLYLNEAIDEFKKAVALDPGIGHAEFFLGLTYLQMNEWGPNSQSFEHLRAAVRLAPHEYLSNFYLGAIESTDGSDLASSNRHLHAAADADPSAPEVWLYLGLNAAREKDTASAKTYLRKAVALTGDDEARNNYQIRRVYAVLGRILISEGNHAEGDPLLARYKSSEQRSIGNSSDAISAAAAVRDAHSGDVLAPVSALPLAKSPFPGMATASASAPAPAGATKPPQGATKPPTPEVARQLAATEAQLSQLLASSFNDLGTAEARQGQYEPALAHFQEAERWQPPTPALLHNLGAAAFRLGHFKESARALGLYLAAQPRADALTQQDQRSQMMLAMSLFSLGRFSDADKAFTVISDLTLQDSRTAYSWAFALAHSGQEKHANQIADALSAQTLPSDTLSLVCHLYMDTENYDHALGCYRKAYAADPALKLAHYQASEALIRLARPTEAVQELRQEIAHSPDNVDVQYSLAFALLQSSQKAEAMALLERLTQSSPSHAQAQYQLGKGLLEDGHAEQAIQHLELAEKNDPAPDYIHYQLQAAYRKAGRIQDADRELALYRDLKARNRAITPPK